MATTTKLTASNGYYGNLSSGQYSTPSTSHLYVGKNSGDSGYRSRVTFPAMSSIAEIGSDRIRITGMKLHVRRNDGGPTAVTVGCSASSAWDAQTDASVTQTINADSDADQIIDLAPFAAAVAEYPSKWYLHFTAGSPRIRLDSTGRSHKPYLMVTWEKAAATITGDRDTAELGKDAVTFTIAPEVDGETHTLTYSIGDRSGVIAERAGNSVVWTPPIDLASETPDSESAAVAVGMTAYDAAGNIHRTEVYYQTVTVPESVKPAVSELGISVLNGLRGYLLAGRSSLSIAPKIDMTGTYGASIRSLAATVTGGTAIQWTSLDETDPGMFSAPAAQTGVLPQGNVTVELTVADSRGRTAVKRQTYAVQPYSPPVITHFSVERWELLYDENETVVDAVASDVGSHIWVNLSAQKAQVPASGTDLNALTWTIIGESADGRTVSASYESTGIELPLEKDITIFIDEVSEDEAWTFTATVADAAGGMAVQYSTVAPGHAALSISPDKWGTAIGMISRATKASPMFEVAEKYLSRFHGKSQFYKSAQFFGGIYGNGIRMDKPTSMAMTIEDESFAAYSDALTPRLSRVGPMVFMDGYLTNTASLSSGEDRVVATLPELLRPAIDVSLVQQGTDIALWWLRIESNGKVHVSRYRKGSSASSASTGSQFPLSACWLAADAFEADGSGGLPEDTVDVPEYWQSYIAAKAAEINAALSSAGSNRSAFLWYTDAHWTTNYGTSPVLLEYLSENTRMQKTFFGGDVAVEKTGEIEIIQAWQAMVGNIPNHHSVMGNHDNQVTELSASAAERAEFFFGPEQTSDMVFGTDATNGKMYYYIDNAAESTRYICLSTGRMWTTKDEVTWCVGALSSVPANWHIVVISHMWLNSDYSDDGTATLITTPPDYAQSYLDLFDAYNARLSGSTSNHSVAYNFTAAQAKIEFIIGGHIHQDYDFATTKGIPVILTECDAWQERDDASSASKGTTTESCVYGVVADYNSKVVKVINVGRGSTRTISIPELGSGGEDAGYTNWLTHVVASDGSVSEGTNYVTDTRISVSSGSFEERSETGWCTTGLIPAKGGDIIRFSGCKFPKTNPFSGSHRGGVYGANEDGSYANAMVSMSALVDSAGTQYGYPVYDADGDNIIQFTIPSNIKGPYIRLVAHEFTAASVLTVNQEIE